MGKYQDLTCNSQLDSDPATGAGSKCDLGYSGADCANREVPRGDDPLTTVKAEAQKQYIQIAGLAANEQFFMRYYDPYGGEWTTNTITAAGAGTVADDTAV